MLEMLPYPSGNLHMGHVLNYTLGDVVTHFKRRQGPRRPAPDGLRLVRPSGGERRDQEGGHPREITERNIANIQRQMRRLGWAIDWDRMVAAHDPDVLPLDAVALPEVLRERASHSARRLRSTGVPNDQTVLANEQVIDGRCERCGAEVEARKTGAVVLPHHRLRGRAAGRPRADRLARPDDDDPAQLDRPLRRRRGAVPDRGARRRRPGLHDPARHALRRHVLRARAGASARRAARRALAERGRAARVRAHDRWRSAARSVPRPRRRPASSRASTRRIPVNGRADPDLGRRLRADGVRHRARSWPCPHTTSATASLRSGSGCRSSTVIDEDGKLGRLGPVRPACRQTRQEAIVEWLGEQGRGRPAISFRLRDWGFSRQRYWGCPIPIVYCEECGVGAGARRGAARAAAGGRGLPPEGQAAARLGRGVGPRAVPALRRDGRREADTMDTFVDSSWYFLRYCDPHNDEAPFDARLVDCWLPGRPVHRRRSTTRPGT